MATLHVRNIPDELYQAIQDLAAREQRSIGAEVTVLLENSLEREALQTHRAKAIDRINRRRRTLKTAKGTADSLTLLREDRAR